MIIFGNTRNLFNITQNPIHNDWKDVSFTSDILLEPKAKLEFYSGIDITLTKPNEEVFIEGACQENNGYDVHFGTIIVSETCQELICYVENLTNDWLTIKAGEIHTWFYCAYKAYQGEVLSENDDFILISKNGCKIINTEFQLEVPDNRHFIRIEYEPKDEEDGEN